MLLATSCCIKPSPLARSRSTSMRIMGTSCTWCTCTSAVPGISAIRREISPASAKFFSELRSGPAICTSIGAGSPKFKIWLTISAGWKKNDRSTNCCGSRRRISRT